MNIYDDYFKTTVNMGREELIKSVQTNIKYIKINLIPHLGHDKSLHILEIGCGYGKNIASLEFLGYKNVEGIDISKDQIEVGKNILSLKNIYLEEDAIKYLKTKREVYKVILLIDVIEHLEVKDILTLLNAIRDNMPEEGMIFIQSPNAFSIVNPFFYGDITHKTNLSPRNILQILRMVNIFDSEIFPISPVINGIKDLLIKIIWKILWEPIIKIYYRSTLGKTWTGIHTSNFLVVARVKKNNNP